MIQIIVIEGSDGAGKTGLLERLHNDLGIPVHSRAVISSIEGPRADIYDWARRDLDAYYQQQCHLYDRHPFVSEYVYGPIVRGYVHPDFLHNDARSLLRKFSRNVLMLYCDPGVDEVLRNIHRSADDQMEGVSENARRIYYSYAGYMVNFPGQVITWDYTHPASYEAILTRCSIQHETWSESFHAV